VQNLVSKKEIGISPDKGMLVDLDNGHFNNRQIEPAVTVVVGDDVAQRLGLGNLVLYRMIRILDEGVVTVDAIHRFTSKCRIFQNNDRR